MKLAALAIILLAYFSLTQASNSYDNICYSDSCTTCDAWSLCDSECTGMHTTYSYYCYDDFNGGYPEVDCYCELSGLGISVSIILPLIFLCWCCAAIGVGGFLCHKAVGNSVEKTRIIEAREDSYIVYSAAPPYWIRIFGACLSFATCGIFLPFIVVRLLKDFFSRFWFAGEQGEFTGNPLDYCVSVCCVNNVLSCITFGFWVCCGCAERHQAKWIDNNTSVVSDRSLSGDEHIYLFQARPVWYKVILARILSCFTCGLAAPFFVVRHMKETVSQMRFGKRTAEFAGDTDDYVDSVCLPNCIFNCLTCHCYSLCGFADLRTRRWLDSNIRPPVKNAPQEPLYVPAEDNHTPPPYQHQAPLLSEHQPYGQPDSSYPPTTYAYQPMGQ